MLYFTDKKSKCTGCGACAAICPQDCISFVYDDEGFFYPQADPNCTNCGMCYSVCPIVNEKNETLSDFEQFCVAARHIDDSIWRKSSSGGAFSAICQAYCKEGDGIFGARFDGLKVVHDCVYSPENIDCFRKSKYVQSDMNGNYVKIKDILDKNRKVLFTGTPCQVAAVKSFLGREYDNLLCVDLVCHGVGSPGVFEKYIVSLENKYGSKVVSFSFRNKKAKLGRLLQYVIVMEFENGLLVEEEDDLYNTGFIQALFLRPSCGNCKFANKDRVGDITVADFKKKFELLPRARGIDNFSTIIVNTKKGAEVFKSLQEFMEIYSIELEDVIRTNPPLRSASNMNPKRENFFHDLKKGEPIEQVFKTYITNPPLIMKLWMHVPDRLRGLIKRRIQWIRKLQL